MLDQATIRLEMRHGKVMDRLPEANVEIALVIRSMAFPNFAGLHEPRSVMPGLDPGIHPLRKSLAKNDGLPGQARQ